MRRWAVMAGLLLSAGASAQVLPVPGGGAGVGPAVPPLAVPVPKPGAAEARRAELDRLLDALPQAPSEEVAAPLQARIQSLWAEGGTPAVGLLLRKGLRAMEANQPGEAVEDLDAAITLQPDFPESWILRAQAQAAAGERQAAVSDLREALRLEPRHFGALLALSDIQEDAADLSGALRSLDAALKINPRLPGGAARRRELVRRARGDAT
ncbi:tetratricopeptide repeat protein [Pararoseomonas indoligenes]|uniref:Tetratricopeptide repeat protein n=1 Tax=Roseomonas indoligenes TaxID=2820811 RepID=A0A940MWF8_9PROT|nr:tetratricopeptide repeat protein [Pararoseomonas indoligenes]MBP0493311.1 tetratricopeptide repeat protein [Pararoseomonas indoligenes]